MVTEGIRLRLQRAAEIFDTLGEEINATDLNEFGTVEGEFDEEQEAHVFIFRKHGELPQRYSLLLGEYVYHLRSSLDNLVTRRAIKKRGRNAFPMYVKEDVWIQNVESPRRSRDSPLFGLPNPEVALIKQLQPFHAADIAAAKATHLAVLNRISNKDKHDAMHACFAVVPPNAEQLYLVASPDRVDIERRWQAEPGTPLLDGTRVAVTALRTDPDRTEDIMVYPALPIGVAFSDDQGKVVDLKKVRELWDVVAHVIAMWDESVKRIQPPSVEIGTEPSPPPDSDTTALTPVWGDPCRVYTW